MSSVRRHKMCKDKVSFTTKKAALKRAEMFNQRVYECPVCFCFHCTSKEKIEDEFVGLEFHNRIVTEYQEQIERQKKKIKRYGKIIRDLNEHISKLKKRMRNEQ